MIRKVFSFSGFSRSGKDTLADFLVSNHNFVKLSLADSLKEICSEKYNIPLEHFYDLNIKDKPNPITNKSPRDYLLEYAQSVRAEQPKLFISKLFEKIDNLPPGNKRIIIPDCRKPIEINELKKKFGENYVSIYITRFEKSPVDHPIEYELTKDNCMYNIDNSNSLFESQEYLKLILNQFNVPT